MLLIGQRTMNGLKCTTLVGGVTRQTSTEGVPGSLTIHVITGYISDLEWMEREFGNKTPMCDSFQEKNITIKISKYCNKWKAARFYLRYYC